MSTARTPRQEAYAFQKVKLKRAIAGGFFYEAILIEYAILEDRSEAVLSRAGVKTTTKSGNSIGLGRKLKMIRTDESMQNTFIQKRLTPDLIESVKAWKEKRDDLTHALLKRSPDYEAAETLAKEGAELSKEFDNKVHSVVDWFDKKCKRNLSIP